MDAGGGAAHAHELRQAAEAFEAQGNLHRAIEARQRSAQYFTSAAKDTGDAVARGALQGMALQQEQAVADLQRKLEKGKQKVDQPQSRNFNTAPLPRHPRGRLTESAYSASPPGRQKPASIAQSVSAAMPPPSSMYDSRTTRRSNSPSESSVQSPASSIFPEGSYMVLREPDPSDPFTTFNTLLEGMLQNLSNPVAFAATPIPNRANLPPRARKSAPPAPRVIPSSRDSIADSFFVVPSATVPTRAGVDQTEAPSSDAAASRPASKKTLEELALENESLKTNLDNLARQYEQLVRERVAEREALKGSIMTFGKEVRREAERAALAQSMVQPRSAVSTPTTPGLPSVGRVQELETQLLAVKQELATANASAQKYKGRYDQLRDAIKKKRATRDAEAAAAAGQETSNSGAGS